MSRGIGIHTSAYYTGRVSAQYVPGNDQVSVLLGSDLHLVFNDPDEARECARTILRACSEAERHRLATEESEPYPDHTSDRRAIERQEVV